MTISAASVPHVLDPGVLDGMAERLSSVASGLGTAVAESVDRWGRLREVFEVRGAEGAYSMLDRPAADANEFIMAVVAARTALMSSADYTLPRLRARREELLERIPGVNEACQNAAAEVTASERAYWTAFDEDQSSDRTIRARERRMNALHARDEADRDRGDLVDDIDRFRRDVEGTEEDLALELTRITGGTEVHGAWGEELSVSQTYWGWASAAYDMGPITRRSLSEELSARLSDAVLDRVDWLGTADEEDVRRWVQAHPDFPSAVGLVAPVDAVRLWDGLVADSHRASDDSSWTTGPLAQLFALAPFAVGNLNGLKAPDRNEFNRQYLAQLLARDDLGDTQREQLTTLRRHLAARTSEPDRSLLSLFLETDDGSPRASVAYGDVDDADQINTLTHGIETDLGSLGVWSSSAIAQQGDLAAQLDHRGSSSTTATVLFMEWDSGGTFNVWNIERPDGGAQRMAQLLRGFETSNPAAQRNVQLHSLGTTAGTQMIADNAGLVDGAWLYGSAGITEETRRELQRQIAAGELSLHVTHADDDWVAPLGRVPMSEHSVDPRDIAEADVFGSDGGEVDDYLGGEFGERVEGHNSQGSTEWVYRIDGLEVVPTPEGGAVTLVWDDEAVGYLDPRSQAYKQSVVDLANAAIDHGGGTR
ncbi:alpha/beta hydrolase [Microbacterium marinum]|uniref:alpha/beta hydrolase n=1 Tax=Microbacterium marinum TaxID=421115 RepID=UPI003850F8A7